MLWCVVCFPLDIKPGVFTCALSIFANMTYDAKELGCGGGCVDIDGLISFVISLSVGRRLFNITLCYKHSDGGWHWLV